MKTALFLSLDYSNKRGLLLNSAKFIRLVCKDGNNRIRFFEIYFVATGINQRGEADEKGMGGGVVTIPGCFIFPEGSILNILPSGKNLLPPHGLYRVEVGSL